jgi:hypothetical protein
MRGSKGFGDGGLSLIRAQNTVSYRRVSLIVVAVRHRRTGCGRRLLHCPLYHNSLSLKSVDWLTKHRLVSARCHSLTFFGMRRLPAFRTLQHKTKHPALLARKDGRRRFGTPLHCTHEHKR